LDAQSACCRNLHTLNVKAAKESTKEFVIADSHGLNTKK
jgi:hypothetical protein